MRRRDFIKAAVGIAVPTLTGLGAIPMHLGDPAFLGRRRGGVNCPGSYPFDDFEAATDGALVNGLTSGCNWGGPYVARTSYFGLRAFEDFESHSSGAALHGVSPKSADWPSPFAARRSYLGLYGFDDMESYSNGAALNGLNGGQNWGGPYVAR